MDGKHLGACSELLACAWLLTVGFEVHRNVSQHGAADLIAVDPETRETFQIDVKTVTPRRLPSGYISACFNKPNALHHEQGIIFLYVVKGECYIADYAPPSFIKRLDEAGQGHRVQILVP